MNAIKATLEEQAEVMLQPVIIAYGNSCYEAQVLDCVAGTTQPKRVRIMNDVRLQGKVLQPGQYELKGVADED